MRALICILLLTLVSSSAWTQEGSLLWNWYYVHPTFLAPEQAPLLRFGTARVVLFDGQIRVDFTERAFPEMKPTFVGLLDENGGIKGKLTGFFFHEPEMRSGHFKQEEPEKGCLFEEVLLRTGLVDGAVIMVARLTGECGIDSDPDP